MDGSWNSQIYCHWTTKEGFGVTTICSWLSQAWNAILSKMITVSFLECGITNNLDGSQYELVYYSTENTDELDDSFIENIQVFASDFTLRQNLKVLLFKDAEHFTSIEWNAVVTFKLLAVLWLEIMFMNCCYDNNWHCEFRYINKNFKLQHL